MICKITKVLGSRRLGREEVLGLVKGRRRVVDIRVRKLEGHISSGLKVDRPHFVAVCLNVDLRTRSVSHFRYFYSWVLDFGFIFQQLIDFVLIAGITSKFKF